MCGENIGSCVKNLYLSSGTEKDLYNYTSFKYLTVFDHTKSELFDTICT